jgi:ribonuclease BN (tRNA processing enzyme)
VPAEAAFGHAAAEYAAGLGRRAGARRVALAHHKPDRTDDELEALARSFASGGPEGRSSSGTPGTPEIFVAAEGGILEL